MKKLHLLKTMLLLCALIVGNSSVWATLPQNPLWIATALSDISDGATVVIISNSTTATNIALPSTATTSSPAKKACTVTTTDGVTTITPPAGTTLQDLAWTLKKESTSYKFFQEGSSTIRLYLGSTSSNTALKVGDAESNNDTFVMGDAGKLLKVTTATRYVGPYDNNGSDWRTYNTETATNYKGAALTFYVLQAAPSYTITPAVNDEDMGSAILSGLRIIATPNDGYRVKAGAEGYTVTSGSATVTNNGDNTFTVSTSEDCTVQINFEAIPTYTLSGVVSPVGAGTVTFGSSTVREGATTSATASANSGYKFTGWSITGTEATLSSTSTNPTTVTMGTANATVTATFEAVKTHTISYSVNGVIIDTQNVEEDAVVDLSAPGSGIPSGYVFKGWVTEANKIDTPTDTDPSANYVTSATSTVDITYYAVMAIDDVSSATATLTASHTENNTTYGDHEYTDDKGNTWSGNTNEPYESSVARIGLRNTSGSYLESPTFPGNVTEIVIMTYNGSSSNRTFNIGSTKGGSDLGTVSAPASTKLTEEQTASLEGTDFKKFFLVPTGAVGFSYISVTYETTTSSNYCTTATVPATITDAEYATFVSSYATDFSETGITVYTATDNTTYVKLNEVTSGQVPANTPVVLYKAGADGSAIDVPVIAEADPVASNDLSVVGTGGLSNEDGVYVLAKKANGVGFYLWDKTKILNEGKVCLRTGGSSAREFLSFDEGETTGINAALMNNERMNNEVYNLNGQRVAQPTKGLYIVNGRKVVIK